MTKQKATVHKMDGPNVGHFDNGHVVQGAWAIVRYYLNEWEGCEWLHWETFNTEDEAIAAKDRWEKEGRI